MIPITRQNIKSMSDYGAFDTVNIELKVSTLGSESMISLCMKKGDYRRTYSVNVDYDPNNFDDIPISGFPRKLMTEDSLASKLLTFFSCSHFSKSFSNRHNIEIFFRGLVSRVGDPYLDYTMTKTTNQLRSLEE